MEEFMPLLKRLLGSVLDNVFVFILFMSTGIALNPYGFPGDLGIIAGIFSVSPSKYLVIEEMMSKHISLSEVDIKIALLFIVINGLYYYLTECIFKSSLGKRMLGGRVVIKQSGLFSFFRILARAVVLMGLMWCAVYLRYLFDINYPIVIILYILCVEVPVLIKKSSLIDIVTGTVYVKRVPSCCNKIMMKYRWLNFMITPGDVYGRTISL